jgi:hypothetical protein
MSHALGVEGLNSAGEVFQHGDQPKKSWQFVHGQDHARERRRLPRAARSNS